ncbi:MAG TPA: hypothetical protein PKN14_09085 [Bacteroidia bacterium]|nr:MAG: hypothetical protein UZ10_BCD003000572 [Bacteroidetes bacterium OLB10]MBE7510574.1 hypothetical protein [Bacteroidia bacterium]MBX3106060.1 hypothetical protein [Bacteroidota bacterium]MCB0848778.1 hypothetical protein [Bacteroidota bacterium]MCB8931503.1 hypothetical protein [Bacteroidia bacterium]
MKILRILEVSWLLIAIGAVCAGTYKCIHDGLNQAVFIYVIAIIATIFFLIRRKQRITMQKKNSSN